jgi:hypothetical protein
MKLKNVLLINAISSGITGILLVLIPDIFANIFKTDKIAPFVEVGIFLILLSSFVLLTAFKKPIKRSWIILIIGFDIAWVVISIITIFLLTSYISAAGSAIIFAVAAWVGLMAYLQIKTTK